MNQIKHLWEVLFKHSKGSRPINLQALWQLLQPSSTISKLVYLMPKPYSAVIKSKCHSTKY